MFTKRDLKKHLEEISEGAVFVKFQFTSTDNFSIQLKCKAPPDQSHDHGARVADWVSKFSGFTATTWIVRSSYPNRKRMVYRKMFVCHRSSFNKRIKQKPERTRNQECRASIDFRIKFINKNTIKNDPLLKRGLNLTISIDFTHSHKLWTAASFNLLKSTSETDEMFYSYLSSGYSPTAAKLYHVLMLTDRYGANSESLMNANINPKMRHVHYLHKKFRSSNGDKLSFEDIMATKRSNLQSAGGLMSYDNPDVVVVVTPAMKRAMCAFNLEHVLVDSSPVSGSVATFLYVPSQAGALTVACVLHSETTETSYKQALHAVRLILERTCNSFALKLLTVKECKDLRDAANAIFPNSNVLTSKWSLCSEVWQWLFRDDVEIESKSRHSIMELINKLIRADSVCEAEICYNQLKDDKCVTSSAIINDYIDGLWAKRDQWLTVHETNEKSLINGSTRLVEASIRLTDEFVHRKCKSFSVYVMIDVITSILENQARHVLSAHATGGNVPATHTRLLCDSKVIADASNVKRVGPHQFKLEVSENPKKCVRFSVDTWCCDCAVGMRGRFCEHLCSIANAVDTDHFKPCELTDEEKCILTEIAGGDIEKPKTIKYELNDNMMELGESDEEETDNEYCDEASVHLDADTEFFTSPKSETYNDDEFYYLDVKAENCAGIDPLEEPPTTDVENNEGGSNSNNYDMPSTSGVGEVDMKRKYEDAMKDLNNEFRRLNKYLKRNPNKANMETMIRLARELSKIRPIERVDLSNMQIMLNAQNDEYS